MKRQEIIQGHYTIERTAMVKNEATGFSSRRKVGTRSGLLILEIDAQAILNQLGSKALNSKSGKAKLAHGAIVVRATNVKDLP